MTRGYRRRDPDRDYGPASNPWVVVVLAVALAVALAALVLLMFQVSPALVWFSRLPEVLG
jgi:hypothetical protein